MSVNGTPAVASVLDILIEASNERDQLTKQNLLRTAQIVATSSLTDAVKECTTTLKEVAHRQIDATRDLDQTLCKVIELRKTTTRQAA